MPEVLFDKIHDAYLCKRTEPATMEEFITFGLQPEDYVRYVSLQQQLQATMLCSNSAAFLRAEEERHNALKALVDFCKDKDLIAPDSYAFNASCLLNLFERDDAEYYHGWLRYPKSTDEFRLAVERKLSTCWNEEAAYILETYGDISFDFDARMDSPEDDFCIPADSPVRIKRYDPDTQKFVILNRVEVKKLHEIAQREKLTIEKEIETHLAEMPHEHDAAAVSAGLPWIKKLYNLCDRQEIIESVFESISEAVNAPDIYKFKDTDVLFVYCDTDACKEADHLLSDFRVDFAFLRKPNKQYTIKRCKHCKQFRISLPDLIHMYDNYDVPRAIILYDDDIGDDFSDFPERSFYYRRGYTVSQTVGLSAAQRQKLLKNIIETKKRTKYQVIDFLKRRMNINGRKPGNEVAFQKWKEDYDFIRQLQI